MAARVGRSDTSDGCLTAPEEGAGRTPLFGVKETWFISWGLQQIDVDEETPRSTRLNVESLLNV